MVRDSKELLSQALDGDKEALGVLLENYKPYLLALARRYLDERLQRRLDPNDIVQTTFMEAYRDFGDFRGVEIASLLAWLRHILHNNVATAHQRHLMAQKRSAKKEAHGNVENSSGNLLPLVDILPSEASTPSQRVMRNEAAADLFVTLQRLPETQAQAILLRYIEGFSLAEISQAMEKSEDAVAGLLKRGLRSLRKHMANEGS